MKVKHYIALAALTLPLAANAQSINFETENEGYTKLGVFDTWEKSPFRTGALEGNVKVIANPYKEKDALAGDTNMSDHVLAFQRSRWGSNTFGVRVTLKDTIKLSQTPQYVHVKMRKPKSGRVMCFALGSRQDRPWQSKDVVQVEATCKSKVYTDKWFDAVFALTGANGVNVHSLVFAPDVESTHDLNEDFVTYIDDIEVNGSALTRIEYNVYPVNFDKTATKQNNNRYTNGATITSGDGTQTISTNQQSDKRLYQDRLSQSIKAKAGEKLSASVQYTGGWMNAYLYLDRNNDGKFDTSLNANGTPATSSDVLSYSNYKNKNSVGAGTGDCNTTKLPDFTLPSNLTPGFYRLRFKVDWDEIDAGGNTTEANNITHNSGVVIDTRLNVHGDKVNISRGQSAAGTNGEVLKADGSTLDGTQIEFGKAYTIKFKPGDGFRLSRFTIRHGYNLKGDSLVNETPQYIDVTVPAYMVKDNLYTIPAEYVDGDVMVTPEYVTDDAGSKGDYALNFPKDLKIDREGKPYRALNSLSFNTTTQSTAQKFTPTDSKLVYQDFSNRSVYVKDGDVITTNVNYTPDKNAYMHVYLYVDLDNNGTFSTAVNADGTPAWNGEMLSYLCYNNKNSRGENASNDAKQGLFNATNSIPQFSLPQGLPKGKYRARLKIDWDDIDPAGHYNNPDKKNQINENGGYVVDFNFEVVDEYPMAKLDVRTTNGSIVGANNTGLSESILKGQEIAVQAVGLDENYSATSIVVRHGENLDGEQTVDGKKQWNEYTATLVDGKYTVPAENVDGDVRITANFEDNGSEYKLVFGEEFDGENGSQPNSKYWSRSSRENPTWKRFCAQTEAGQKETGWIEDGKLVLRCLKNTHDDEKDGDGNKQQMISGSIESSNKVKFTYGKVEGRLMTIGHAGNFPAFWMMPNNSVYGGWPYSGEIDIWEQIDAQTQTHHTIHTKWANSKKDGAECMNKPNDPPKTGNSTATLGEYHVFGLEWTEDLLTWYLDGKQVFSYARKTDLTEEDKIKAQWPFDQPFYLILNQSVGNGGWAAAPDLNFTYETKFDWVRVYQTDKHATGANSATKASALDYYVTPGNIRLVAAQATKVQIFDLQGRVVFADMVQGNKDLHVNKGIYLVNGSKVLVP